MCPSDITRALQALLFIPSDLSYPDWFKVICAALAAGISIENIIAWCSTGNKYKGRHDVEATIRSIKPDGGIGPGTLFHLANQYGYTETGKSHLKPSEVDKDKSTSKVVPAAQCTSRILAHIAASWEPATASHPYIHKKLGLHDGLHVYKGEMTIAGHDCHGALVLPLNDLDGNLVAVQFIPLIGKKVFPKGIKLPPEACLVVGGTLLHANKAYILEGIGQAWTAHQATRLPAVVCFGKARMDGVAKAIHAKHPGILLVIVPDAEEPRASR